MVKMVEMVLHTGEMVEIGNGEMVGMVRWWDGGMVEILEMIRWWDGENVETV